MRTGRKMHFFLAPEVPQAVRAQTRAPAAEGVPRAWGRRDHCQWSLNEMRMWNSGSWRGPRGRASAARGEPDEAQEGEGPWEEEEGAEGSW